MTLDWCVQQALTFLEDDVQARFAADPLGVLRTDLGMTVTAVQHLAEMRDDGGACDGVSFLQDDVILYASTPESRRENFTLAHELGHWLVDGTPAIYDWLADQDDPGRLLETACDRIAQALLLPDSVVRAVVGRGPVVAQHFLDLYEASHASRPVCAIALARQLPGLGAVVIVDRYTRLISHASVKPDPERGWPKVFPWRGQHLDDNHPLLRQPAGVSTARRMPWRMKWGTQADFYVDAIADERRVYGFFSEADLWAVETFHAPIDREYDKRVVLTGSCCGAEFERRGYPCPDCGQAFCPRCQACRCDRDAKREVMCSHCFVRFLPHLVVNNLCVECRS